MFRVAEFAGPIVLVLWIFCVVDVITTREDDVRNLPKIAWIFPVLLFPFVGSIAWLVAGRPKKARPSKFERRAPDFPEYDRPGGAAAVTPETDEEFLRRCRERAEEQRKRAKQDKPVNPEPEGEQA